MRSLNRSLRPWRVGLIVVDNDAIPELEIRPTDDNSVCVVVSRFRLNRAPGSIYLGETAAQAVPPEMIAALQQLDRIGVDAVGLCFTSSSVFSPDTFDTQFAQVAMEINDRWTVSTAALSIVDQMHSLSLTNPFLLIPPWFSRETVLAVTEYLDYHNIGFAGWHRYQLGPEWQSIQQQDLFDRGAGWAIDKQSLITQATETLSSKADSILVPGSGFLSHVIRDEIQSSTSLSLISANESIMHSLFP